MRPSYTGMSLNKSGITIHRQRIEWPDVTSLDITYNVGEQAGSVGGALAGKFIAGDVGAIVGGMRSTKKVEPYVRITYEYDGEPYELLVISPTAEKLQKEYLKKKGEWQDFKAADSADLQPGMLKKATNIYFAPYKATFKLGKKIINKGK